MFAIRIALLVMRAVKCKGKLVLSREEVNVDGPNLIEGDVTFRRMGLYTK